MPVHISDVFGSWTVISDEIKKNKHGIRTVLCRCSCGLEKQVIIHHLESGASKTCRKCSYLKKIEIHGHPSKSHGMSNSLQYRRWRAMVHRCTNPKNESYADYGGRGITVCQEWMTFPNFWRDMGVSFQEGFQLDRMDNNKGYCKENCRWVTPKENARNRRNGRYVTVNEKTLLLCEWVEILSNKQLSFLDGVKVLGVSLETLLKKLDLATRELDI